MATIPEMIEVEKKVILPPRLRAVPRKKPIRRPDKDYSQVLRFAIQTAFLLLNAAIGLQFYLFAHYFESGGQSLRVARPAGVDGWLPIGGIMNLKYFIETGNFPRVHPAAMLLLLAFLLISILFRKAFCGWLCPIGTISEGLWKLGRKLLRMNWRLPRWVDLALRSLKYILLGLFVYAVAGLSAAAIQAFLESPYGLVSDVKMLNFFRFMGSATAITLMVLAVLSVMIKNFWCRYLCPYGALMGLASLLSPTRIRRVPDWCIDCAKCAHACPALLAVDKSITVRSAECTACLECVAVCPAQGALRISIPTRRTIPPWALAAGIAAIFLGVVICAKLAGIWRTNIPDVVYFYLGPRAQQFVHP
ncbi:MAG: 4Fe-4S binding protein [Acidobacteriota bacterium]